MMNKNSIWLEEKDSSPITTLEKDLYVDVLIIGGGITGLSTAYHLIDSSLKVAVVESNLIGHGVTAKTTGKLTYLQETVYSDIKKYSNLDAAKVYYDGQREAISLVKDIVDKNKIKCDLTMTASISFTNDTKRKDRLEKEKEILEGFGVKVKEVDTLPNGEKCLYAISVPDTYVFHPLKYLYGLKKILKGKHINVYEKSKVVDISKNDEGYYICKTEKAFIKARQVVLALHYPYFLLPFLMPGKVTLEKSYVGAREVREPYFFNAISVDDPVKSIRYHQSKDGSYQILLYGSHNICKKYDEKDNFSKLKEVGGDFSYLWSNIDMMTGDKIPYIGRIDKNLFLGTGYNTWGMTNGSLAGKILSEKVMGRVTKYDETFSPKRGMNLGKVLHFPVVLGSTVKSYVGNKIFKNKEWYNDRVRFEKKDGKSVAIYTDMEGIEHIVYQKCPHLGCTLIFNQEEETWDCPCHGSRFNIEGHVINGPSNYDISYKEEK